MHQGDAKIQATLHSAGVGSGWPMGALRQPDMIEHLGAAGAQHCSSEVIQPAEKHQIVERAELFVDRVLLGDDPEQSPLFRIPAVELLAVEKHLTTGGRQQSGQHQHRRAFARPIRSQQTEHLAPLKREADVVDGELSAITLSQMSGLQQDRLTAR